jgi:hypothetical protein
MTLKQFLARLNLGLRMFATDVVQGFFAITHNGLAVLGLSIFFFVVALAVRPDLRSVTETKLISWLQERQYDLTGIEADTDAVDRATAIDPRDLPRQQANLAYWLSKKYRVAPEPLSALVSEAYDLGAGQQIEPTLILGRDGCGIWLQPLCPKQYGGPRLDASDDQGARSKSTKASAAHWPRLTPWPMCALV